MLKRSHFEISEIVIDSHLRVSLEVHEVVLRPLRIVTKFLHLLLPFRALIFGYIIFAVDYLFLL